MENEALENEELPTGDPAPAAPENQPEQEPPKEESALGSFLDSITEGAESDGEGDAPTETKADGEGDPAVAEKNPAGPETPEQIEHELLEEVKSERGQRRVRALMDDHKALQQQFEDVRKTNEDFGKILKETGLPPEGFAQVLEYSRLIGQGGEQNMRVALQMLDAQREEICKALGVKAPGVDPLSDFQDLRMAVENMELSEDRAMEIAKLRRQQAMQQQAVQQQTLYQQQQQEYTQRVQAFSAQATALFQQLQMSDPAYKAKEAKIAEALKNPTFVQSLIANSSPEQWVHQLKFMYDNIQVQPVVKRQVPLRSRPTQPGVMTDSPATGADRVGQIFDSLGI